MSLRPHQPLPWLFCAGIHPFPPLPASFTFSILQHGSFLQTYLLQLHHACKPAHSPTLYPLPTTGHVPRVNTISPASAAHPPFPPPSVISIKSRNQPHNLRVNSRPWRVAQLPRVGTLRQPAWHLGSGASLPLIIRFPNNIEIRGAG